jgi:hypothetical protein
MSENMQEIHLYLRDTNPVKVLGLMKGLGKFAQCGDRGQDENGAWYMRLFPYIDMRKEDILEHDVYGIVEGVVFVEPEARA